MITRKAPTGEKPAAAAGAGIPTAPGADEEEAAWRRRQKALEDYAKLNVQVTNRIKELSLEETDYKLWQLDEWYRKTVDTYRAAGKDTADLTRVYTLEQVEILREAGEKTTEEVSKRGEEYRKYTDEWTALEHSISSDLMTEVDKRKAAIRWEYEARLMQIEHLKDVGILDEAIYTQAVIDVSAARDKKLKESEKTYLQYIEEMNKQTALNIQQSWSNLIKNTMTGEFKSFGDWFNSFMDSMYSNWSDTLAKMAYKWVNEFIDSLSASGTSGGGGSWWESLLGSLLSGLVGTGAAQGEIFNYGRIHPFARGTVVTGPTIFPMAEGYGLIGEKGFEAVMPLARTVTGDLGVKTVGGKEGKSITINGPFMQVVTPDADSFRRSQGQIMAEAALSLQRVRRNL